MRYNKYNSLFAVDVFFLRGDKLKDKIIMVNIRITTKTLSIYISHFIRYKTYITTRIKEEKLIPRSLISLS
jgi:hypothetical protein